MKMPLILCLIGAFGATSRRAVALEAIKDSESKLLGLQTAQLGEARKLDKVASGIKWLLDDLASNGLSEQGDGKSIEKFRKAVEEVADTRLPDVAEYLRKARTDRAKTRVHLAKSDAGVDAILRRIGKILAGSSAMMAEEQLVQELRDMIKVQIRARQETAEWGKTMLITPESAAAGKGPLIQDQANILTRFRTFLTKLQKAIEDAVDDVSKSRFGGAMRALKPPPPTSEMFQKILTPEPGTDDVMQAAIDMIERTEVLSAIAAQDRAIASMKAALQILSESEVMLAEFVAGLEKILEKQKALRKDTAAEKRLEKNSAYYEARQIEISDEVVSYSFDAPDMFVNKAGDYLVEPLTLALEEAAGALEKAEKEKALAAQDKVIALLESVFGAAIEALEEEKEGDSTYAHTPEIPEDMYKLPPDSDEEDEEEEDEDMPDIFDAPWPDELFLAMMPKGTTEGAMPDATPMAANRFIGLDEESEKKKDKRRMISDDGPPSMGSSDAPDDPGGKGEGNADAVEKEKLARDPMRRRRQKARIQDYVQQLPPEFRRQVAEYYEAIGE